MEDDCIFCKIVRGDFNTPFIYENEEVVAFRDINPQAPSHILIVPRQHIARISDLSAADQPLMGKMVLAANAIARQEKIANDGYRLVFNCGENGGQEVEHIHLHLLGGRKLTWPPG